MTKRSVIKKRNTKFNSWKTYQSESNTRRRVWLGVLVLATLLLVILVGKVIGFFGSINSSFNPDSKSDQSKYSWDGETNLNILIKGSTISVANLNPTSKSLTLIKVPDEVYTSLPKGFGNWPIRSVYGLGQSEKNPIGANLLKLTVSNILGLPIDGYLLLPEEKDLTPEKAIEEIRSDLLGVLPALMDSRTDLTAKEYLKFVLKVRSVRFDKVKNIDLAQTNSTKWILLPDGTRGLEINTVNLDKYLSGVFEEHLISQEGVSIAVYNATDYPTQAEKVARMITNLGGRVVLTSSTKHRLADSLVLGEEESLESQFLSKLFSPACRKSGSSLKFWQKNNCDKLREEIINAQETSDINLSRAQITVIVGEDFYHQFNTK